MDYLLTEEQQMIKDLARKIAEEKVVPARAELDESEEFPHQIVRELAQADMFGVYIPEKYGGLGGGCFEVCLVIEELSRACGGVAVTYATSGLGAYPILLFGTEEQKKRYLPQLAKGEILGAFALTEADAGSDAGAIRTTAEKQGDSYILNGTKQWITNGGEAQVYVVIALTDKSKGSRGASAFIVEKGTPGFSFGKREKKMGIRCSATRELIFDNCKVPSKNLVGKEGLGFMIAMRTFDMTRPGIGAQAVGIAQGAFEEALDFSRQRVQFGQPISSFQAIQHMLADMATQIEAARALVYATARTIDSATLFSTQEAGSRQSGAKSVSKDAAMAKLFASDVAMRVTTDAVQILGGSGYMREYPVEKMMRDAKVTQIYEGTNQIQRNVIALQLIKERAKKN